MRAGAHGLHVDDALDDRDRVEQLRLFRADPVDRDLGPPARPGERKAGPGVGPEPGRTADRGLRCGRAVAADG
eukprot:175100-Alexandrium_andersonii.AAC.1